MNRTLTTAIASFSTALTLVVLTTNGCSSDDKTGPATSNGTPDSSSPPGPITTPSDSGARDSATPPVQVTDAGTDSSTGDGGTVKLTLKNYLAWCSVTVNGGAASTADQVLEFAPGTVVNLNGAKANDTFVWGYWRGTAGDTTGDHDKNMMTTVTMDADKTVQACCPFAAAPGVPCPAP